MKLDYMIQIPGKIQEIQSKEIRRIFPNPTLVKLEGDTDEIVFLSVLLHGNETSGFEILKNISNFWPNFRSHRTLVIFIGNVWACENEVRQTEGQEDFNRIWSGGSGPEFELAREVLDWVSDHNLFAAIDVHNNSGVNPLYACINKLERSFIYLASFFSSTLVYFVNPSTVLSMALSKICPSVTLECGRAGNLEGIERVTQMTREILQIQSLETHEDPSKNEVVYQTIGRIKIKEGQIFEFGKGCDGELVLPENIEELNFQLLEKGFTLGGYQGKNCPLCVYDENESDITSQFIRFDGNYITLSQNLVPSMFTKDKSIIRSDCLGYFMTPIKIES